MSRQREQRVQRQDRVAPVPCLASLMKYRLLFTLSCQDLKRSWLVN